MRVLLQADGAAARIEWQQGNDTILAEAAFRAIRQFRFLPPGRDADPENGWIYIPIHFSLDDSVPTSDPQGRKPISVTPEIRRAADAPALGVLDLQEKPASRRPDTIVPAVSQAELAKHFYYPDMARFHRYEGAVLVHAKVDRQGRVISAYALLSDNPIFDDAAVESVSRSRFTPGRVSGRTEMLWTVVPVRFLLNRR